MPFYDLFDTEDKGCLTCIGIFILMLSLLFGLLCFKGWMLMLLWNAVMPAWLGLPALTFWPAVGVMVISNLLFKSTTTIKKE